MVHEKYLAYKYLFKGRTMIEEQYALSNMKPFLIHTPEMRHVMVTSRQHIRELDKAPRSQLSLHAVAKAVCVPALLLLPRLKFRISSFNPSIP